MEEDEHSQILSEARAYYGHRNYETAIEIYSSLLPTLNPETITYGHVLLEYALCLLDKVNFEMDIGCKQILQGSTKPSGQHAKEKNSEIEEDIEICWDSLETCRVSFEVLGDRNRLSQTHKALGDIHALNNESEQAVEEYRTALGHTEDTDMTVVLMDSIGDTYRTMGEYNKAIKSYKEVVQYLKMVKQEEKVNEYEDLIEGLELLKHTQVDKTKRKDIDSAPKDINHLKKTAK